VFQRVEVNATQKTVGRNVCKDNSCLQVNACHNRRRISRRTTLVAHRSACFKQDNMLTDDVHPIDVLIDAMESVTLYEISTGVGLMSSWNKEI